jgi:protocatechuate 3,4-dioxygenase beta subunit
MRVRTLLGNRFVLVPAVILLAALVWNLYVSAHNDGLITGRVVDEAGRPVAGATVRLMVLNVTTFADQAQARSDAEGRFRFTGNTSHHVQLQAESPTQRSERLDLRLWFQGQDTELAEPLVVQSHS